MEVAETDSEDELPPGWEERCTVEGLVFYAHHGTKATQWTHPRTGKKKIVSGSLPLGWQRVTAPDGGVHYQHSESGRVTYTDPRLAFAVEQTHGLIDLRQRFDSSSTGLQVLHGRDLTGTVAVVTGANSGIGLETARSLAWHGCTVVLACRDVQRAQQAQHSILMKRPFADTRVMRLDLASLTDVRRFATELVQEFSSLHILVLNAGIFNAAHQLTDDGVEQTFQVNHLSHFYLAHLLLPVLTKSFARVVWLTAESHRFSSLATADDMCEAVLSPSSKHGFSSILAYNNSKLCNLMIAFEMQRRFGERGVKFYAVHPGNLVYTGLTRSSWLYWTLFLIVRPWSKSLQQACASSIYCCCSPELESCGGVYVNSCLPCPPSNFSTLELPAHRLYTLDIRLIERSIGSCFSL